MAQKGLILTGFMGMGKSTVGPAVAEYLGVAYFDTDAWMETVMGIDIPHLVKTDMTEFRRAEAEALRTILDQEPGVVSTGGGIVSTEVGRSALLASGALVVWLKAPFEVAATRVIRDQGRERPLFNDMASARALFDERQLWYEETADHEINASRPQKEVIKNIISVISSQTIEF